MGPDGVNDWHPATFGLFKIYTPILIRQSVFTVASPICIDMPNSGA